MAFAKYAIDGLIMGSIYMLVLPEGNLLANDVTDSSFFYNVVFLFAR